MVTNFVGSLFNTNPEIVGDMISNRKIRFTSDIIQITAIIAFVYAIWISQRVNVIEAKLIFELGMVLFLLILAGIYGNYRLMNGSKISTGIVLLIKKFPRQSFRNEEQASTFLSENFPFGVFSFLSFWLMFILLFDFYLPIVHPDAGIVSRDIGRLTDVIYGLTLDGIGAALLGIHVYLDTHELEAGKKETQLAQGKYSSENSTYHFWGAILLTFGFILQIVAIFIRGFTLT